MSCQNSHNAKFTFVHVNTKFRSNYYNTSSSNFNYQFPNTYSNVTSLKLDSICIPNTWYLFSSKKKNNVFFIETNDSCFGVELHQIIIPDGNYSIEQLETFLNKTYFYLAGNDNALKNIKFSIHENSLKSIFSVVDGTSSSYRFTLKFAHSELKNISFGAGWILGFRYAEYLDVTSYIMSEGLFDGGGDRYVYFCLDDFNHSSLNPHEVCFEKYSANESVLAKIYLTDGKFAVNIDDSSNGNNIVKTRKFAGPIDLSKIKVKILDQYGDVVDLNYMDFSFSLQVCINN